MLLILFGVKYLVEELSYSLLGFDKSDKFDDKFSIKSFIFNPPALWEIILFLGLAVSSSELERILKFFFLIYTDRLFNDLYDKFFLQVESQQSYDLSSEGLKRIPLILGLITS